MQIERFLTDTDPGTKECNGAYRAFGHPFLLSLLDSAPAGIIVLDKASHLFYINRQAEQMIGEKAERALGKPANFFIDDASLVNFIAGGDLDSAQPYIWNDRSLLVTAFPLVGEDSPQGCFLLLQKIPDQEMADKVSRLEGEFTSLLESSYDGIILADTETILNVNAGFGRITGIAPSLLVGKKIAELDVESHVCLAAVQEVIRLTHYHRRTLTLQRKLSSGNEIFVTGSPVLDRHGQVIRVLLNVRDVTELKALKDQIKNISSLSEVTGEWSGDGAESFQGIVADSPATRRLLDLVLRVSQVDSTVLLQGESGVGKDVFARLIHRLSKRCQKPLVAVNCGAIPEALLESEMFGYEKGAFTGAGAKGKAGLFEEANHGILFLDEVGELPLNLQVKLLKVIQDRRCRRLGGLTNVDLDLRIIGATNRDLNEMVSDGLFRSDLFYRLYVVPIDIPPLRDRREDILPLSLMFLSKFNTKYKVSRTLGHEVLSVLETYDWPGNVRELQNIVERMVVTADTDILTPCHLPNSIYERVVHRPAYPDVPSTMNLKKAREIVESEIVKRAIARTGNTRKAAKLLGVDHSTVVRKAQRYGLNIRAIASLANQEKASPAKT